jgi:hypothetical protein
MTKKIVKVAVGALLLAILTVATANAQTNSYRTNVLLNLSFSLTAYEQTYIVFPTNVGGVYVPTAKSDKVVTDGIIRAIAKQAQITNDLSNAKLYLRLSWTTNVDDITRDIIVRKGTEDTVVNNYIAVDLPITLLAGQFPDSVTTLRATLSGNTNVTDYANCTFELHTIQGSFSLHGIATIQSASLFNGRTLIDRTPFPTSFTASVTGSGGIGYHPAEWKGTVMGSGQKVEIEQISP